MLGEHRHMHRRSRWSITGPTLVGPIFGPVTEHNTITSSSKSESDYIGEA